MEWLLIGFFALTIASTVISIIGARRPSRSHWVVAAFRLRYLAWALLFFAVGGWVLLRGLLEGSWGSVVAGIFLIAWGGLWLYARGGIGPDLVSKHRWPLEGQPKSEPKDDLRTNG